MNTQRVWITLSEALSWLAFGQELQREVLLRKLAGAGYNSAMMSALRDALAELMDKARDDAVVLRGKAVMASGDKGASGQTAVILAVQLADYRAFDITTDGLRYGEGLQWLPDAKHEGGFSSVHRNLARDEHFVDVYVNSLQLRNELKAGPPNSARLSKAELNEWWRGLPEKEQKLGESQHCEMLKQAFPDNHVTRERLRQLRRALPRVRGRPGKSP